MRLTTIAAKLRKTAVEMEAMAANDGDLDYPDEFVVQFIVSFVTDRKMAEIFSKQKMTARRSHAEKSGLIICELCTVATAKAA
jgi:hypothetical protein